ncbi:MAG: peptidase [Alkalilacustris sp.]
MRGCEVVRSARAWIGTPWQHGTGCRGVGSDCLGLIRGIWHDLGLGPLPDLQPYGNDWAEIGPSGRLVMALAKHLEPCAHRPEAPGDVLVFRLLKAGPPKHLGVLAVAGSSARFIHACAGHGVLEVSLTGPWRRRLVTRLQFPEHQAPPPHS